MKTLHSQNDEQAVSDNPKGKSVLYHQGIVYKDVDIP
jgi:hypothetical protein